MAKKLKYSAMISFMIYPCFLVLLFIINLFNNRSFSFFGFGLDLNIQETSAEIGLFIKPHFFLSFIFLFALSLGTMVALKLFRSRERVIK